MWPQHIYNFFEGLMREIPKHTCNSKRQLSTHELLEAYNISYNFSSVGTPSRYFEIHFKQS